MMFIKDGPAFIFNTTDLEDEFKKRHKSLCGPALTAVLSGIYNEYMKTGLKRCHYTASDLIAIAGIYDYDISILVEYLRLNGIHMRGVREEMKEIRYYFVLEKWT